MCIRAYLSGDGTGNGTHLSTSIFFVLIRGKYDPLLQFERKVRLILVDQDQKKIFGADIQAHTIK